MMLNMQKWQMNTLNYCAVPVLRRTLLHGISICVMTVTEVNPRVLRTTSNIILYRGCCSSIGWIAMSSLCLANQVLDREDIHMELKS